MGGVVVGLVVAEPVFKGERGWARGWGAGSAKFRTSGPFVVLCAGTLDRPQPINVDFSIQRKKDTTSFLHGG